MLSPGATAMIFDETSEKVLLTKGRTTAVGGYRSGTWTRGRAQRNRLSG